MKEDGKDVCESPGDRARVDRRSKQALYYGTNRNPLLIIVPDPIWPGMFRIWANDRLSDLGNLTQIKNAAEVMAERGPPHRDLTLFRWKSCLSGGGTRPLVRFPDGGAA